MPASRTSRLSVRPSPNELILWNHLTHSHGHVTTSNWIRSLLAFAEFSGNDGPSFRTNCAEYAPSFHALATTSISLLIRPIVAMQSIAILCWTTSKP